MKCRGSQKRQVMGKKAKADEERVVQRVLSPNQLKNINLCQEIINN